MKSEFLKLATNDFIKGLVVAVIVSILTVIYTAIPKVGLVGIDWNMVLQTGIISAIGYILKQFGTDENGSFGGVL